MGRTVAGFVADRKWIDAVETVGDLNQCSKVTLHFNEVVLQGDWLTVLNEAFCITRNGIPGHFDGFFYGLTVSDASRKCGDQHSITSFRLFSKSDSITESSHESINTG